MNKKFEISRFTPCVESIKFREQYPDFKSAWNNCPRGDWMLWIAKKLDVDLLKLTTAKALCANTVRHLMKDERSIKAIDVALLFGQGKATRLELNHAADAAYTAYTAAAAAYDAAYAAYATAYAAYAAAYAAYATAYATAYAAAAAAYAADTAVAYAYATADTADAAVSIAYATAYAAAAADAKKQNQLQTADICRQILTEVVFEAIDKLI